VNQPSVNDVSNCTTCRTSTESPENNAAVEKPAQLLSAAGSRKFFFAISKWRMASNVSIFLITVSTKNRIFCAKRQLSLIPLNRTAVLPQH